MYADFSKGTDLDLRRPPCTFSRTDHGLAFPIISDPSAGQLIAQFLYQADAAVSTARETREKEKNKNGVIDLEPDTSMFKYISFLSPVFC